MTRKLKHEIDVSTNGEAFIASWDRVTVQPSKDASGDVAELLKTPIKSISATVEAGEAGYLDVEFYGDPKEVRRKLTRYGRKMWMGQTMDSPGGMSWTFRVRFPIQSISMRAISPMMEHHGRIVPQG